MNECEKYKILAKEVKRAILNIAYEKQTHHVGSFLSIADLLTILYFKVLKINPKKPQALNRDRFILSKGHAALALYVVLAKKGFFDEKEIDRHYLNDGGKLGVHPDKDVMPGIEISSGSLGHGLSVGIGLALAAKNSKNHFRTFVLLGDGECNEGSIWEAAMFAGHHKLDNLIAVLDYNHLQGFGRTEEVIDLEPLVDKWYAFGWAVKEIDGHNIKEIINIFNKIPFKKDRPSIVIAHTIKAKGIASLENKLESHYKKISQEDLELALKNLD